MDNEGRSEYYPMLNGKEYTSLMQESIWNSAKYIGLNNPGNKYLNMLSDAPAIGDNPTGDTMMSITKIPIGWIMCAKGVGFR